MLRMPHVWCEHCHEQSCAGCLMKDGDVFANAAASQVDRKPKQKPAKAEPVVHHTMADLLAKFAR